MKIHPSLSALAVQIADLTPDPRNARRHGTRNLDAIRRSLERFGQRKPIVVQREGMIVRAGNGFLEAARALGWTEVAAVLVDEADVEATAYAIADNRTAELASWDDEVLAELLASLQDDPSFDHLATGFTDTEIARLRGPLDGECDPDFAPPRPAEPETCPGDLWLLGPNRVLCGSSTVATDVERAFGDLKPWIMVTDPPYGVSYDPAWRVRAGTGGAGTATGKVLNDDRADWREAWSLFPGDVAYVWHGGLHAATVAESLAACGFALRAQIVWIKTRAALSRGAYHWQHEPALFGVREGQDDRWRYADDHEVAAYAVRRGEPAAWSGDRRQSTVWQIDHLKNDTGHGTQKPVDCMERPIWNHGAPGDVVYDPFLGSGTTLIAAHRAQRRLVGLELDPGYVDVIVKRWETYTGEKARLERAE